MTRLALPLLFVLLAAGCGGEAAQAPTEPRPPHPVIGLLGAPDLGADSRMALLDASQPDLPPLALAEGFAAAGAASVHHTGERYCFLARTEVGGPVRLYTAPLPSGPAALVEAPVDAHSAPAWLADGCIVYAATAIDGSRALYCIDPDGGTPQRITFSGTDAHDPCVLHDGRVLYAGERITPEGTRAPALFAVHSDGIGQLLFHGATPGVRYRQPQQVAGGDVLFHVETEDGTTRPWVIDWRAPSEAATPLEDDVTRDLAPLARWPGLALRGVVDAAPRRRPQGHSTLLDLESHEGTLLCSDAGRGVSAGAAWLRLHARVEDAERGAYAWTSLGRVPLEADGSFHVRVPADTPLRLDVLAEDGSPLRVQRTPFWVRPGEIRGCTGCHDQPDMTPPNVQPAAALLDAVRPTREEDAR